MGITERKEREKSEMRRAVLEAAMQLFIEDGYEKVSIRKIADKIEYSPASIYTYFEDKGDIFYELHNEGFGKLLVMQQRVQDISDPKERLSAHGRAYLEFAFNNPEYYDIMFIMRSPTEKICKFENWEQGQRSYDILLKNVEECKETGLFDGQDKNAVAFLLWSTVHGIASLHIRQRLSLITLYPAYYENLIENSVAILKSIIR